jgi:tetratricopeptide (TPR) repeat protein
VRNSLLTHSNLGAQYAPSHAFLYSFQNVCSDFNSALEINPQLPEALVNRGIAHLQLGQPEKAIHDLEKSAGLIPNNYIVRLKLALAYSRVGDSIRAAHSLHRAVTLNEDIEEEIKGDSELSAIAATNTYRRLTANTIRGRRKS